MATDSIHKIYQVPPCVFELWERTDRQTNKQTNKQTCSSQHFAPLRGEGGGEVTIKPKQSYRHANPRQCRNWSFCTFVLCLKSESMAYSYPRWEFTIFNYFHCGLYLWPFDLGVSACRETAAHCTSIAQAVFLSERGHTDRQKLESQMSLINLSGAACVEARHVVSCSGFMCNLLHAEITCSKMHMKPRHLNTTRRRWNGAWYLWLVYGSRDSYSMPCCTVVKT